MNEMRNIVCQPFIKLSTKEMGRVKYLYEMASELEWGKPKKIEELVDEAEERGLLKRTEEDNLILNYEYKYYDIIPPEERTQDVTKFKSEELEKPVQEPNTKREKTMNLIVKEHRIDPNLAVSEVNKKDNIDSPEKEAQEIASEILN